MSKLYLTFLWHQHQPYYRDPVTGRFAMPWVRLHAVKDYIGMANLLAEFPAIKQTINLVPSLVRQISEYVGGATDTAMALARIPAESLSSRDAVAILNTFFQANWETLIHPHPRYRQLLARCELSRRPREQVAREFSVRDLRDLQVWGNLAWFHPTVVAQDAVLGELVEKGADFTEDEKHAVLDKQLETMAQIVPLHSRLARSGQLELTTSPFYHTLAPLLCDAAVAQRATPDLALPAPMLQAPEDAAAQIERAVAFHERTFGARPRGLWPSEGAVSEDAAALFAGAGIEWIVTDEEILAQTLGISLSRDKNGLVDRPEDLYVPYRLSCGGRELNVIFRDHALSDRIGFRYQLRDPREAAEDLLARLEAIRRAAPESALVVLALDGENCWEYYRDQGVEFLRNLYRLLSEAPDIETTHISDYLAQHGPGRELDHLFPGSWVGHSFASWMGHTEKNRAWEHLARAREYYVRRTEAGDVPPDAAAAALDQIYIAEGSDWFWWYGEDHTTGSDAAFDALFRKHLRHVYERLGGRAPDELLRPLLERRVHESWAPPSGAVRVQVDGRRTSFFEWLGAGTIRQAREVGTMERSHPPPVASVEFGFGADHLFLRLDVTEPDWTRTPEFGVELWLGGRDEPALVCRFDADGVRITTLTEAGDAAVEAVRDRVVEIGAPLERIGLEPGQETEFFLRVFEARSVVQRIPVSGTIPLVVPEDPEAAYLGSEGLV